MLFGFVVLAVFVVTTSAQMAARGNARPPVVVKGAGTPTPQTSALKPPPPPPPDLSAAAKADMVKALGLQGPGSLYFKVTPRNSKVPSRGEIDFFHPTEVADGVYWSDAANDWWKFVQIYVKSEGMARRYLIDCSVQGGMMKKDKGPFKIWLNEKLLQTVEPDQEHIIVLLETTDSGWYEFEIRGGPVWSFHSCEVTRF